MLDSENGEDAAHFLFVLPIFQVNEYRDNLSLRGGNVVVLHIVGNIFLSVYLINARHNVFRKHLSVEKTSVSSFKEKKVLPVL